MDEIDQLLRDAKKGGTYYKVNDDGAKFRCTSCRKQFNHDQVIVWAHTETRQRKTVCLDCIDTEWLDAATCLGSL